MLLKEVACKTGVAPDNLVGLLVAFEKANGKNYLTKEDIKKIAAEEGIAESELCSVATFYTLLATKPRGKHIIQICTDVPCYINGSCNIKAELEKLLGISMGETTKDGLFTLEHTSCLGCCEMSPAMRIDDELYGNLTADKLFSIIAGYRG